MNLSYRTRRRLQALGIAALSLVLVAIFVWLIWLLWLDRYVVYTRDAASIDFNKPAGQIAGQVAVPPEGDATVPIYYNDGSAAVNTSTELRQMLGFYADGEALRGDIATVTSLIKSLPAGTPVMLDVKNISGYFYYSTQVGTTSSEVNISAMDQLIQYLRTSNLYTIARIPAFQDYHFGLNNVPCGLYLPSYIGLWMDDEGCYWLDPDSAGTQNYLIQIITELKSLGFDEVVLTQFRFPVSDGYTYDGDKTEALNSAAANLVSSCASSTFAVSFSGDIGSFTMPEGRCRLYLEDISAVQAADAAALSGVSNTAVNLVFLTEAQDTRFDAYGVLRPISYYHVGDDVQQPVTPTTPSGATDDPEETTAPTE